MSKPIKNNSQMLYLQARQMFERAKKKFEDNSIQSEPKLIASVFNSFQEFFTSVGKPNMVPRFAPEGGPPWSEDFNQMMLEIKQDLELLFQEMDIIGQSLYTDFNHNTVQHEILNNQYENIFDKMRDLEIYAEKSEDDIKFGRDDFLNKEKIDYSRIVGKPLEIVNGAVTLPQKSRENVALDSSVTIIAGNRKQDKFIIGTESNGFPGNNTEIHSVTDDILTNKNYIPTFLGEENNHSDYSAVLDGSPNTWFEYEKVNVREHDKVRVAKNLGWNYQVHGNQTIQWAEDADNGSLKLHMQIILKEEKVINEINLNMYTPSNYGAKTAIIKNILVSDGKNQPKSVLPKNKKDNQYQFHFAPVKVKVISILFEQPHKYITDIGHIFYEKKTQSEDKSEYAMDMATKKYKYAPRVEGPLISLEDLGIEVKVNESSVEANYPLLGETNIKATSIGETINRLMNSIDLDTIDMGVEKFEGFRWCIGIRDIEIWSCEYEEEGELVTFPFFFDKALDKISLNVNQNIPQMFSENPELSYEWLKYFISIDDGTTWHPITPLQHQVLSDEQPPKIYTVRTVESSKQKLEQKDAYLESEYPVYSLRLKVLGRRPNDYTVEGFMLKDYASAPQSANSFTQASPLLTGYNFNLQTISNVSNSYESEKSYKKANTIAPDIIYKETPDDPITETIEPSNLKVSILNKTTQWCDDKDLTLKCKAISNNSLSKAELYIGPKKKETKSISGAESNFEFTIPALMLPKGTTTISVRAYDQKGMAFDVYIFEVVTCDNMPEEDKPVEPDKTKGMSIILDKYPLTLCENDQLIFYGSVQSSSSIRSISYTINGILFEPEEAVLQAMNTSNSKVDLMEIEDFGEWLDAFEEQEGCGCKNKKKQPVSIQEMPAISIMGINESSIYVKVPYQKLTDLGVKKGDSVTVSITAYDTQNLSINKSFSFVVEDCRRPDTNHEGKKRVRDCYKLEDITLYYYLYNDNGSHEIKMVHIPASTLPLTFLDNGAGAKLAIGWSKQFSGPVLMLAAGNDESKQAFQIHAISLLYSDYYDDPHVIWPVGIGKTHGQVSNIEKILVGSDKKDADWFPQTIQGDFSSAPSLGEKGSYVIPVFENDWIDHACDTMSDFNPDTFTYQPSGNIYSCNLVTHILVQYYNDVTNKLEVRKISLTAYAYNYRFTTKNGEVVAKVGWEKFFKSPAIQIISGTGKDNILITALGVLYRDRTGVEQTRWSQGIQYKSAGVSYPEHSIGALKSVNNLLWLHNGTVDYSKAPYVGGKDDVIVYRLDEDFIKSICPSQNFIETGISSNGPEIQFKDAPKDLCGNKYLTQEENPNIKDSLFESLNVYISDTLGIKSFSCSLKINGKLIKDPEVIALQNKKEFTHNLSLDTTLLDPGDTLSISVTATNESGISSTKELKLIAVNCKKETPVDVNIEGKSDNIKIDFSNVPYSLCANKENNVEQPNHVITVNVKSVNNIVNVFSVVSVNGKEIFNEVEKVNNQRYLTKTIPVDTNLISKNNLVVVKFGVIDENGEVKTDSLSLIGNDCTKGPLRFTTASAYSTSDDKKHARGKNCFGSSFVSDFKFSVKDDFHKIKKLVVESGEFKKEYEFTGEKDTEDVYPRIPMFKHKLFPRKLTGHATANEIGKIDIVLSINTYEKLEDLWFHNMKQNVKILIQNLIDAKVDARVAIISTGLNPDGKPAFYQEFTPVNEIDLSKVMSFERLKGLDRKEFKVEWNQFTDPNFGLFTFNNKYRHDAVKHAIVFTSLNMYPMPSRPENIIPTLKENNIITSIEYWHNSNYPTHYNYEFYTITKETGGLNFEASADWMFDIWFKKGGGITKRETYTEDTFQLTKATVYNTNGDRVETNLLVNYTDCRRPD